jgi:hypothetical protein
VNVNWIHMKVSVVESQYSIKYVMWLYHISCGIILFIGREVC